MGNTRHRLQVAVSLFRSSVSPICPVSIEGQQWRERFIRLLNLLYALPDDGCGCADSGIHFYALCFMEKTSRTPNDSLVQPTSLLLFTLPAGAASQTSGNTECNKMYVAYYGRPGDPGGVAWWADQLEASGGALEKIIDAFATSDEFIQTLCTLSNEQLVANLYQQMFGRTPEQDGLEGGSESSTCIGLLSVLLPFRLPMARKAMTKPHWIIGRLPVKIHRANWAASQKILPEHVGDAARNMILQVGLPPTWRNSG